MKSHIRSLRGKTALSKTQVWPKLSGHCEGGEGGYTWSEAHWEEALLSLGMVLGLPDSSLTEDGEGPVAIIGRGCYGYAASVDTCDRSSSH
jgi:hypothetical protein